MFRPSVVVTAKSRVAVPFTLSRTCTVKLLSPPAVGVPENTPLVPSVTPAGSVPVDTLQV